MFKDFCNPWPEPERHDPPPKPPVSRREEDLLLWLVGIAMALMLFGPLAGISIIDLLALAIPQ